MARPRLPIAVTLAEDGGAQLPLITNYGAKYGDVEIRLTDLSGWDDSPDVRSNPQEVPSGDDAYDDGPLFGARTYTLKGVALAGLPGSLLAVQRQFRKFMAGAVRHGSIVVQQQGMQGISDATLPALDLLPGPDVLPSAGDPEYVYESLLSEVRLGGSTVFNKTHPLRAEWSIALYAADHRRYSTTARTWSTRPFAPSGGLSFPWHFPLHFGTTGDSGRIPVVNDGDVSTGVQFRITGGCTNPQIFLVETGERISLVDTLPAGVVVDIDTRTGRRSVLRDGAPYGWVLSADSDLFQLPVGESTLLFRVSSGTPLLTATWRDATP